MRISTELIREISAPTISTSFDFRDLVNVRLMFIVLCPPKVQITVLFCHDPLSLRHRCVIIHEVEEEPMRGIRHYHHNENVAQN